MRISGATDIGKKRKTNQDSFLMKPLQGGDLLAVVCDGMGGMSGGNIASQMAVDVISEQILTSYSQKMGESAIRNLLVSAILAANIAIHEKANENSDLIGMGTTVVLGIMQKEVLYFASAGDSRGYLIEEERTTIRQVTHDHSIVQEMIDAGKITREEAKKHPRKNIITRALGVDESIDIDFFVESVAHGDILLLCTDGLTNFVQVNDILRVIQTTSFNHTSQKLIDIANNNGGGDNVTAVLVKQ